MAKKVTPMMEQYLDIKSRHSDELLFFRLGDFYELFNEDALIASRELNITLTGRPTGNEERTPMCGVPFHAAESYIETLVKKGYKVAICEQLEDPKAVKGIVKRDVIQVITPGTVMTENGNDARSNNFLALFYLVKEAWILVFSDVSTGEVIWDRVPQNNISQIYDSLSMYRPAEIIVPEGTILPQSIVDFIHNQFNNVVLSPFTSFESVDSACKLANNHFQDMGLMEEDVLAALGFMLLYLQDVIKTEIAHINYVHQMDVGNRLILDTSSLRHLEITHNLRDGGVKGTLLDVLDRTLTPMGARLLKQWLDRPLIQERQIKTRQEMVQSLLNAYFERLDLQAALTNVYDLERLAGRVAFGSVNGRDLIQLRTSLEQVPTIRQLIVGINQGEWDDLLVDLNPVEDLVALIATAINEEAPLQITEGNVIKDGYNDQLDEYRDAMRNGKQWLAELEAKERQETGIKNLKIGYNRVFGYFIEITKSNLANLEEGKYERKQTLANAERFITPELKELERLILEAEEKSVELEYQLFLAVREQVKTNIDRLQTLAKTISAVDVLQSFATISERYQYVRPTLRSNTKNLAIVEGRHPVVEKVLGHQEYIPNSIRMNPETDILLITGPNMSGKSTYMRQLALTVVMAQIGCFVPAESAEMPIFDQIFTRIGASDDLIAGQSTFMVEMMEANQALRHATPNSLILFDELGRGTATYDGMALAQAIIEYIHREVQAKTLFSTHYHELTVLDETLKGLKNIHVGAVEKDGEVVFLHKMMEGPADKSYGIHVAKIAGLPSPLLERAATILSALEAEETTIPSSVHHEEVSEVHEETEQLSLFKEVSTEELSVIDTLKKMNLLEMTPLDALNMLHQLQKRI